MRSSLDRIRSKFTVKSHHILVTFKTYLANFEAATENVNLNFEINSNFNIQTGVNKNYYVVRNAGCARSRYALTLSLIFLIN